MLLQIQRGSWGEQSRALLGSPSVHLVYLGTLSTGNVRFHPSSVTSRTQTKRKSIEDLLRVLY